MNILLVEDEKKVASFIRKGLLEQNNSVDVAFDGEEGLFFANSNFYDLIILDWMLPKKSGLEFCETLRNKNNLTPILMLTAKDEIENKILGLDAGADDYLTKPFSFSELLARTRALVRRGKSVHFPILRFSNIEMDLTTRKVTLNQKEIFLSSKEFALLEYFLKNKNKVVSRTLIAEKVWGLNFDTGTNNVDVYVSYVRSKIQENDKENPIKTIRGVGYILQD